MIVFIDPNGRGVHQESADGNWSCKEKCCVTFCGVKIFGVVFADDKTGFVRVSVPDEKHKAFEKAAKPIFNNFVKIGKYDSGYFGYEFTAPNLKIIFN